MKKKNTLTLRRGLLVALAVVLVAGVSWSAFSEETAERFRALQVGMSGTPNNTIGLGDLFVTSDIECQGSRYDAAGTALAATYSEINTSLDGCTATVVSDQLVTGDYGS